MEKKPQACSVRYSPAGKLHRYGTGDLEIKGGDRVVVDMEPGQGLARVVACSQCEGNKEPSKRVVRLASDEDLAREQRNRERGEAAYRYCRARIEERRLEMRLVKVEYLFDGSKAVFFFTSEGRVDFRELVKDLTREFNTRIEMRQIGVRDAAKQIGWQGPCGQVLCCSAWLVDFTPVSVRMAKDQNLSLNPNKLSGVCGRLKCCLSYEHSTYVRLKALLPKLGSRYESEQGVGKVVKQDVLKLTFTVAFEDGLSVEIKVPEPESLPPLPSPPKGERHKPQARRSPSGEGSTPAAREAAEAESETKAGTEAAEEEIASSVLDSEGENDPEAGNGGD